MLKALAAIGTECRHPFLLYQSMRFSVIDYGLGLTTLPKLDRGQNEAMRVVLGAR